MARSAAQKIAPRRRSLVSFSSRVPHEAAATAIVGRSRRLMTRAALGHDVYVRGKRGMIPFEDYIIFNFSMRATRLNPAITSNWLRLANIPVVIRPYVHGGSFQIETNSPERTAHYQDRTSIRMIDRSIGYNVVRAGGERKLERAFRRCTARGCNRDVIFLSGMLGISCISYRRNTIRLRHATENFDFKRE